MIKKILTLLFAVVLAAANASCGKAEALPVAVETSEALIIEDGTPDEPAPDDIHDGEDSKLETGIIVYSDGATLIICSPDGRNLNFLVAGGEVDKSETRGLVEGSKVDVYYIGGIDGSNTSAAQVTKLVQSQNQAAVRTDVGVTGGIILESDGASLKISTFNGDVWTFLISGGEVDRSKAKEIAAGDFITIFYDGEIIDGKAGDVKVTKLVQ